MLAILALLALQDHESVLQDLRWLLRHQDDDGAWRERAPRCSCPRDEPAPRPDPAPPRIDPHVGAKAAPLIAALGDDVLTAREAAEAAIRELGPYAVPSLRNALAHRDPEVRARVVDLLHDLSPREPTRAIEATSLALAAFLGAGYSHLSRDMYDGICVGDVVRNATKWLMAQQGPDGLVAGVSGRVEILGHALAAFALSESYGMTGSSLFKDNAQSAIDFLSKRARASGAWGDTSDDAVATYWALSALYSAEISGLNHPREPRIRGVSWLRDAAGRGGSFEAASYMAARIFLDKTKADLDEIASRLARSKPADADPMLLEATAVALFQYDGPSGPRWKAWNDGLKNAILSRQAKAGCERGSHPGPGPRALTTALGSMTLQVYYRYANVFGGK